MKKKSVTLAAVAAALLLGFGGRAYAVNAFNESDFVNLGREENKISLAEKVLADVGRERFINAEDVQKILVENGDFDGDGVEDKAVVLDFYPNLSVVAVYKGDGENYSYLGELGPLMNVTGVEKRFLAAENRDVLAIREESVQYLGGYERNVFVRGYLYREERFNNIISLAEEIEADWNSAWDDEKTDGTWKRIRSNAVISWEEGENPVVLSRDKQQLLVSEDVGSKVIPPDDTYSVAKERTVEQRLFWDDEFGAFLLGIVLDKDGKRYGVTEDFDNSPYYAIAEYSQYLNKVRLIDKNGEFSVKSKNDLTYVPQ